MYGRVLVSSAPLRGEAAFALGGLLVFSLACGDSSPTSSSSAPPIGSGGTLVSGHVVGTAGGAPVGGARVEMGGSTAISDASGQFQLTVGGEGTFPAEVGAAQHVTRNTFIRTGAPLTVDIIEPAPLWHLEFYRELCRNGVSGQLEPLKPWTVEPRFYIDRSPESGTNRSIPDSAVDTVVEAIRIVLPLLTRGQLTGDALEIGTRPPADGTGGTVVSRWDPVEVS